MDLDSRAIDLRRGHTSRKLSAIGVVLGETAYHAAATQFQNPMETKLCQDRGLTVSVIEDVKLAVERAAGKPARHLETVPVTETIEGKTVWSGVVEVFVIESPPTARKAFGWLVEPDNKPEYVAVLENPSIETPLAAVRAWIFAISRK